MKCYLCNNEEHTLISEKLRYESKSNVFKCNNCGLVFLYPAMTPEEERSFYEMEYGEIYSAEKGTTPAQLFNARLGDAQAYYELVKDYINKDHDCLELGCASGYFLAAIKDKVRSVTGYETHLLLRQYCQEIGINMIGSIGECKSNQFDRVFMFFLLEHLGNPVNYLAEVRRILKKGGKIFIEIPNVEDSLLSLYNIPAFINYYYTPAHQFYYSKSTLSDLLRKSGFNDFEIKPVQRYDLSNHIHWMMNGKPGGQGLFKHIFSPELIKRYAQDLKDHFICDTLFAVVTKT